MATLVKPLVAVRAYANKLVPNRPGKKWGGQEGWIADSNHSSVSGHSEDVDGSVDAYDMRTEGMTDDQIRKVNEYFKTVTGARYYIWNKKIYHRDDKWAPKAYNGSDPHKLHVHYEVDNSVNANTAAGGKEPATAKPVTTVNGFDYSYTRPDIATLHRSGGRFVCRYLSHTEAKNLTKAEAEKIQKAGLSIVSNWQEGKEGPKGGKAQGVSDAKEAAAQHKACGGPDSAPIYFSVDWDALGKDLDTVEAYFDGILTVLKVERVGVYGPWDVLDRLKKKGKAKWFWQSPSTSYSQKRNGKAFPGVHIRQLLPLEVKLGGGVVDRDLATTSTYGGWKTVATVAAPASAKPVAEGSSVKYQPYKNVALGSRTIQLGVVGADVVKTQKFWGISSDGYAGPKWVEACKKYQKMRGLKVDGIAGPKTLGPIVAEIGKW